ncbi:MAG: DNA polymerase III subunit delta' [Flavobacteriaceae bacterium]
MSGLPRPVDAMPLIGREAAETALREAALSGRLHHGWIIAGPQGSGKATLAYRFARFLLSGGVGEGLDSDPEHPAARQIAAGSHPGLLVIEAPEPEPGRRAGAIPVENVRRIGRFLGSTASDGGWRIVLIDPADGLNRNGQNAILKLLEEPPEKSLFLIVAHQPGRLLPTIRSRCRQLDLPPLGGEEMRRILAEAGFPDGDETSAALRFSGGDVERAAAILSGDFGDALTKLGAIVDQLPDLDTELAFSYSDDAGRRGAEALFDMTMDTLLDWLRLAARERAALVPAGKLAPYGELWEKIAARTATTRGFNLDRSHCILASLFDIQERLGPHSGVRRAG